MVLNSAALRRPYATLVLTFLHLSVLTKLKFNSVLEMHPDIQPLFRKAYVQFVLIRGIRHRAELIQKQNQTELEDAALVGRQKSFADRFDMNDHLELFAPAGDIVNVLGDWAAGGKGARNSRVSELGIGWSDVGTDIND